MNTYDLDEAVENASLAMETLEQKDASLSPNVTEEVIQTAALMAIAHQLNALNTLLYLHLRGVEAS